MKCNTNTRRARQKRTKRGNVKTPKTNENTMNHMSIEEKIDTVIIKYNNKSLKEDINNFFWNKISPNKIKDYLPLFFYCYEKKDELPEDLWHCIKKRFFQIVKTMNILIFTKQDIYNIKGQFPDEYLILMIEERYDQTIKKNANESESILITS